MNSKNTSVHAARLFSISFIAAASAFTVQTALAQDSGWYAGGSAGRSAATVDDARITRGLAGAGLATTSIINRDRSNGFKIYGGYQLTPNFALESGYFDLGKFGFTANTSPLGSLSGDIRVRGLNLDLVGMLPLSEQFSLLGRVGANYAQTRGAFSGTGAVGVTNPNPSESGTNYKLGVGLQYALSDTWAIRGELERYRVKDSVGNRGHIDMASIGLVYRFGGKIQKPVAQSFVPVVSAPPPPALVFVAPPAPLSPPPVVAAPTPAPQPAYEAPSRPAKQGRN